jgi:hypothetical protein
MKMGVVESGDAYLVYGSEVYEEHVYAADSAVNLLEGALDVGVWGVMS